MALMMMLVVSNCGYYDFDNYGDVMVMTLIMEVML